MSEEPRPRPTIDDRLAALLQSVKRLAAMQRENEKTPRGDDKRLDRVTHDLEEVRDSIMRLESRAVARCQRPDGLEDRPQ